MPKVNKTFITTDDTGEVFEFDGVHRDSRPQIWAIRMQADIVDSYGSYHFGNFTDPMVFFVRRETLEKVGKFTRRDAPAPTAEQQDELRETLEKLLSLVGVFPED